MAGLTLTNSQISTIWPKLPSVDELRALDKVLIYDSAALGQKDSSSGLSMNPTATLQRPTIRNYTDCFPPSMETLPIIWIQIKDSTKWIQVPIDLLKLTNQTAIPTAEQSSVSTESFSSNQASARSISPSILSQNWALGIYANPAQICGGSTVYGAFSYGAWGDYRPAQTSEFLYSDILSISDGVNIMQIGMCKEYGYVPYVCAQIWRISDNTMIRNVVYNTGSITINQLYSQYIRYNTQTSRWEFYWNQQDSGLTFTDGRTYMLTGNQPNVCAESNDDTSSHFNYCTYNIGGMYDSTHYLSAIGYLYGGGWHPYATTDSIPSAYTYYGGSTAHSVIFGVGKQGPMSWFGEQKKSGQTYEALTMGHNIAVPGDGSQIW